MAIQPVIVVGFLHRVLATAPYTYRSDFHLLATLLAVALALKLRPEVSTTFTTQPTAKEDHHPRVAVTQPVTSYLYYPRAS